MFNSASTKEFWLLGALLVTVLVVICDRFVDVPVALFVKAHLYNNVQWSKLTSDLPDLLLLVVLGVTFFAFSVYLVRSKRGIYDNLTNLARLVSCLAPVAYGTKAVLKFGFGRINTRVWLMSPEQYGFHWFHGGHGFDGFPSGHMLVVVTLFAAVCRYYPGYWRVLLVMSLLLGIALVLTNYHFVSDVIAGAYLGLAIEAASYRLLVAKRRAGFQAF